MLCKLVLYVASIRNMVKTPCSCDRLLVCKEKMAKTLAIVLLQVMYPRRLWIAKGFYQSSKRGLPGSLLTKQAMLHVANHPVSHLQRCGALGLNRFADFFWLCRCQKQVLDNTLFVRKKKASYSVSRWLFHAGGCDCHLSPQKTIAQSTCQGAQSSKRTIAQPRAPLTLGWRLTL